MRTERQSEQQENGRPCHHQCVLGWACAYVGDCVAVFAPFYASRNGSHNIIQQRDIQRQRHTRPMLFLIYALFCAFGFHSIQFYFLLGSLYFLLLLLFCCCFFLSSVCVCVDMCLSYGIVVMLCCVYIYCIRLTVASNVCFYTFSLSIGTRNAPRQRTKNPNTHTASLCYANALAGQNYLAIRVMYH